ncbi:MAG: molybdate ABC transporter substrate-binding protein [Desulfovibrionaceae bacterium]|nr:molybdate ABC transporter substrate-binding protein [Desulfovibrionaceae bacterium]
MFAADLVVLSGAGLIKPMEELRGDFEKANKAEVQVHYGSSGELFGMLAAGQPCDVLVPGAEKYTMDALKNGWIEEKTIVRLVKHVPVIIVPKGNPAGVKSLADLARPGVKVALGDPKAPAIGRVAKKILEKNKLYEQVSANVQVLAPTANQLLIYVALGQVDASINWADLAAWSEGKGKVEIVPIPEDQNMVKTIPTAVTVQGAKKPLALKFNEFISSSKGLAVWSKWGFEPCE